MDPAYDQRYDYYSMPPAPPPGHPRRSRSTTRYPHELTPSSQDANYYNYAADGRPSPAAAAQQPYQQQYYDENQLMPPPLPPHKPKKKSMLKSPLSALKNAIMKTTKPLRRMNSVGEQERKHKSGLRRQHSMLERGMQRPYYPDEYPTYPAGFDERYQQRGRSREQYYNDEYAPYRGERYYPHEMMNSTYKNLESEDIYGNIGTVPRANYGRHPLPPEQYGAAYEQDDLYANRALIDLERRQAEAQAQVGKPGKRITRRHSTTTADRAAGRRMPAHINSRAQDYDGDDIYQSKQGAYMMDAQRRAPNSEVMTRRRFYPGAANEVGDFQEPIYQSRREMQRELQRNHLEQSKREMQERIYQGKREMDREFSPHGSSQSERSDEQRGSDRESIYQSRKELKESALKTRAQLRDQIYQTRRDALDSMAEPIYVSKRDAGRPEPIYETREESILQSQENETDEKKEKEKIEPDNNVTTTTVEINHVGGRDEEDEEETRMVRSDLQKSSDTVIEKTIRKAPLVKNDDEYDDLGSDEEDSDVVAEQDTAIENTVLNRGMLQKQCDETQNLSDEVFEAPLAVSSPLIVAGPPLESLEPPQPTKAITPRSSRAPFHISNILKRTAPPPVSPPTNTESCSSINTQYTSQASLAVGPPNATSTPYTSNMSLPMAGPVNINKPALTSPTAASVAATATNNGPFPPTLREPTTKRGFFDSNGGTLADPIWNVSLQIPAGAIAPGVRQEIYFTVSDPRMGEAVGGPPLDMENGETMLSPLVMCGPQGLEFLVPVTLNIPHCAGRTASLGLALKATDSEKNIHTEWDNIDLPSNAAAHTVSVKVDHF